jgi:hypothetical protein
MSFPGNYNINYYRGDTLEFNVVPYRDGRIPFILTDYSVKFTIATARGDGAEQILGYAEKSADQSSILCVIRPSDGLLLDAGTTYVYDVQISDLDLDEAQQPYDRIYTILTGNISVTEQVSDSIGAS